MLLLNTNCEITSAWAAYLVWGEDTVTEEVGGELVANGGSGLDVDTDGGQTV